MEVLSRLAELGGNVAGTARECGVPRSCVQDWSKAENQIEAMKNDKQISTRKRRRSSAMAGSDGAKRRAWYPELEMELSSWVDKRRAEGITVSGRCIKLQARKLYDDMSEDEEGVDFHFSNGWLDRFCKRHNLTSRAVTSQGQKVPSNAKQLAEDFFAFLDGKYAEYQYSLKAIGGMDETPLYFDLPSLRTYDTRGVKSVKANTTGKEKVRYTMVLSAMADGTKLPSMVIFRNLKNIPKGKFPKDVVQVATKGSMTSELMNTWKRGVWSKRPHGMFKPKSLIVYDSATSHVKKTVLSSFHQHYSTDVAVIPGGMTPLLQPADVSWNKPFKGLMKDKWIQWLSDGETHYTKTGKRKSASYEMIVNWVSQSWKEISKDIIRMSFVNCGILRNQGDAGNYHCRLAIIFNDLPPLDEALPSVATEEHTGISDDECSSQESEDDDKYCL